MLTKIRSDLWKYVQAWLEFAPKIQEKGKFDFVIMAKQGTTLQSQEGDVL